MKVRIDLRTVLLLIVLVPAFIIYCLINSALLWLKDKLGINRLSASCTMRRRYGWKAALVNAPIDPSILAWGVDKTLKVAADLAGQDWKPLDKDSPAITPNAARGDKKQAAREFSPRAVGMRLPHRSAVDTHTGLPKVAYYLEGSHFEMGYLLGLMAEQDVRKMSVDYVENVVFSFAGMDGKHPFLGTLIADFIYRLASISKSQLPPELEAEIYGIYAGCLAANPDTQVVVRDLLVLNYGVDIILSLVYAGIEPLLRVLGIDLSDWKKPAACNGFTVLKQGKENRAFFGRDFMFPTCGVFGSCCAPVTYVSNGSLGLKDQDKPRLKSKPLPTTSITAPGMVGSVATLNTQGLAMGVDMVNGRNSSFFRVGLNSLMMIRYITHWSPDATSAVRLMRDTPRGVSWLYLLAHGPSQRGALIEAGSSRQDKRFLRHVPKELKPVLPDYKFIRKHPSTRFRKGMGVRWNNWSCPKDWYSYNPGLFQARGMTYPTQGWGERETLCPQGPLVSQVPDAYYFAPQRESRRDIVLGCNHYVIPELRLLGMNVWTAAIPSSSGEYSDFQWRYDTLNKTLLDMLDTGAMTLDRCQEVINFLRPFNADGTDAPNHFYYGTNHKTGERIPNDQIQVGGAIAAMDLHDLRLRCLYGWYQDDWVELVMKKAWAQTD